MSGRWESRANLLAAEMGLAGVPFLHGNGSAPSTYIHTYRTGLRVHAAM